jgi:predicted dehydrogenase
MKSDPAGRRLRAGIVGGGRGAFIGSVHRIAAELDGQALIVAGAMSSDPENARLSAAAWYLDRSYESYQTMAVEEARRNDGIDFVIIATPNNLHFPVARAFLEAGIDVICDKPMTFSLEEAKQLVHLIERGRPLFALTHNYTGYPAVREARELVASGQIGTLRKVLVEYNQDWLMAPLERSGNKQAEWRADPKRAGISNCVADIGSHAQNLLEFVSREQITALCADLTAFGDGRQLDDDANILLRLSSGAKGTLVCSQVACGEENNLSLRLYGSKAGLEWRQQEPNTLIYKPLGEPWRYLRTGHAYLAQESKSATRTPSGHPEGYLEAFAVIYRDFIADIRRVGRGEPALRNYPTAQDGLRGMRFIAKAVESAQRGSQWIEVSER